MITASQPSWFDVSSFLAVEASLVPVESSRATQIDGWLPKKFPSVFQVR